MSNPPRIGLLGLGQRGLQHLKALWQLHEEGACRVVALADAFPANLAHEKLQRYVPTLRAAELTFTTSVDELLDARRLDALYICIPPNVHRSEVVRAARAGLHLLVEKPMSLFLDQALEMQAAIREAGVLAVVGFQQRYDARHEAVRQFLHTKRAVLAQYSFHAPLEGHNVKHTPTDAVGGPANRVWTASRAWSGTTLVEAGIHPLDLWRFWMGEVEWVQASYVPRPAEEVHDGADNPYAYVATFGFASGALGSMTLSRLRRVFHTSAQHLLLWNEGRIEIEADGVTAYHYDGPYPPPALPTEQALRHSLYAGPRGNTDYAISSAFVRAITENRPALIRSPFSDAMNSLAAVLGANLSDTLGGRRVVIEELRSGDAYAPYRQRDPAQNAVQNDV
jgi:predicted dehydrogenase